ncbi:MAG: hypothetical protein QOE80_4434 [Actinomycetota bacterium]|jgi:hypothetical protein|nr:hypothetical protein [Actinomycetota bacterium]
MRTEHSRIWLLAILCGVGLTWPLPLGGALLAVAASFGFVISWEAELGPDVTTPVPAHASSWSTSPAAAHVARNGPAVRETPTGPRPRR